MNISIITVCLNSFGSIERTVRSVLDQIASNDEYIILDGGSTDGTLEYLESLDDGRIVLIENVGGGVYGALNTGLNACGNEIVGIIHSDDFYLPGVIDTVRHNFTSRVDILFGSVWKEAKMMYYLVTSEIPKSNKEIKINHVHPSVFVRKSIYDSMKFSENYKISADLDFFYNCFERGARFAKSDKAFSVMSAGGLSDKNRILALKEGFKVRLRHGDVVGGISNAFVQAIRIIKRKLYA